MRVICTTVRRGASNYQLSGRIIEVDIPSGEIIVSMNLPDKGSISGPRGGTRGGRGVRVFRKRIYVATHNRVFVYDFNWNVINEIWHPYVAGHHEIQVDSKGVWCCSALTDAIIKLDFEGNLLFTWWASEDDAFVSWVGGKRITWDKSVDYSAYTLPDAREVHPHKQFHLNTVYKAKGKVYAYESNCHALFQVWPRFRPVVCNPSWNRAHNVYPQGRDILVNNSALKTFEIWRLSAVLERLWHPEIYLRQRVVIAEGEGESTQFSKSGWIRGRVDLGRNEFIVGSNPASLNHVKNGRLVGVWPLSDDCQRSDPRTREKRTSLLVKEWRSPTSTLRRF